MIKKYMLTAVALFPLVTALPTATMAGVCPIIPGKQIIEVYCSTFKKPFTVMKGPSIGEYQSSEAENPDCTSIIKRTALSARKMRQQTDYQPRMEQGKCMYQFHTGAEGSQRRGEYKFELIPVRR